MHAPGQTDAIPFITPEIMEEYDAFLFGIPTRYGNFPAQWKAFFDATGKQWQTGAFCKYSEDSALHSHSNHHTVKTFDALKHRVLIVEPHRWKICWHFRLHSDCRWWSGEHRHLCHEHSHSPWHDLCAVVRIFPIVRLREYAHRCSSVPLPFQFIG